MTDQKVEEATRTAVAAAKSSGALISFDPNLRPPLWDSLDRAMEKIQYGLGQCDVLKISDNEIEFLTGTDDIDKGVERIRERYDIRLVCATMGKRGSKAYYQDIRTECATFLGVKTIETTGAGDTFMACVLDAVLRIGLDSLDDRSLFEMLEFANAASSIITTRKGALKVMPEKSEILKLIKEGKN